MDDDENFRLLQHTIIEKDRAICKRDHLRALKPGDNDYDEMRAEHARLDDPDQATRDEIDYYVRTSSPRTHTRAS